MRISFLTGFMDGFTILPIKVLAKKQIYPIKYCIFDIFPERKVVFSDYVTIFVAVEDSLSNHQLIPILIIGFHEKR